MRKDGPMGWTLMLWSGAILALCALLPGVAMTGLMQGAPHLAVPATVLGFTLITAANRDRQ